MLHCPVTFFGFNFRQAFIFRPIFILFRPATDHYSLYKQNIHSTKDETPGLLKYPAPEFSADDKADDK